MSRSLSRRRNGTSAGADAPAAVLPWHTAHTRSKTAFPASSGWAWTDGWRNTIAATTTVTIPVAATVKYLDAELVIVEPPVNRPERGTRYRSALGRSLKGD